MKQKVIIDTGPLVAFFNRNDKHHEWAKAQLSVLQPPLITCEAVITEAIFLLKDAKAALLTLLADELILINFSLQKEIIPLKKIISEICRCSYVLSRCLFS